MSKVIKKTTTEKYDKDGKLTERIIEEVIEEDIKKITYPITFPYGLWGTGTQPMEPMYNLTSKLSDEKDDSVSVTDWLHRHIEEGHIK